MTDLITSARELCEGRVDPRIMRTVYELCEALESANKEVERLKAIIEPECPKCHLKNCRIVSGRYCDRCGANMALPAPPANGGGK